MFRIQVLNNEKGKSNNHHKHSQSPEEHGKEKHLICNVRGNAEIKKSKENRKAHHASRYKKTESPALPPEPPEADKSPEHIARDKEYINGIGVYTVNLQNIGEITRHH